MAVAVGSAVAVASTATDGNANGVGEADAAALGVDAAVPPTSTVDGADDRVMTTTPTSRERATAVPTAAKRAFSRFSPSVSGGISAFFCGYVRQVQRPGTTGDAHMTKRT